MPAYGYGCKAHDVGHGWCQDVTDTANGQPHDWCEDQWSIVDPATCEYKTRAVSLTTKKATASPTKLATQRFEATVGLAGA